MSRDIQDLHPTVQNLCFDHLNACEACGIDLMITCTYRSMEEQAYLYSLGRTRPGKKVTNAAAGQSLHNWRVAYDVVPLRAGKPVWGTKGEDGRIWQVIGELGEKLGLEWGGRWRSIVDLPHFQFTNGLTIKDFQSGKHLPLPEEPSHG